MTPIATTIELTWPEVLAGATIGVQRRIESIRKGIKDRPGFTLHEEVWDIDVNGACAELAVAKAMNIHWPASINSFHKPDLEGIQVRLARYSSEPYLIVQKNEASGDRFVLVQGRAPSFKIVGWVRGKQAKATRYLRSFGGRPVVYAVPAEQLHSFATLKGSYERP